MTSDASDSGNSPEGLGSTPDEPGCQPDGKDAAETLSPDSVTFQESSVADYAVTVLAEQIERLRRVADDVDRHYGKKTKRLSFKHRLDYLTVSERVASKLVDFAQELGRLKSTESPPDADESDSGSALSWDPDDPGPAISPPTTR